MIGEITVGGVKLPSNVFLAPLAGVTDTAFRYLAKSYGAGLTYTEMVSAKGLLYKNAKTAELLKTAKNEEVAAVQLFGSDPGVFREVVKSPFVAAFDIIDINMGCPVPKIVGNGEGSALMKNPALASKIISACASVGKPVTVKFRKGFDDGSVNAVEFARMCEDSGACAVCVHGRTRAQMYSGEADRKIIEQVVSAVGIPVIGNGDVRDAASAAQMFDTGVAAVMVGRGALGRPWVFCDIAEGGKTRVDLRAVILKHIDLMLSDFSERYTVANMRKHIAWYLKGVPGSQKLKNDVFTLTDICEVKRRIEDDPVLNNASVR